MFLKIVQHNKETIETCQEKSNGIFNRYGTRFMII